MCNVSVTYGAKHKNIIVTSNETINDILVYLHLNPETKIVYRNGKILSREKMNSHLPDSGTVYLVIRSKAITRE